MQELSGSCRIYSVKLICKTVYKVCRLEMTTLRTVTHGAALINVFLPSLHIDATNVKPFCVVNCSNGAFFVTLYYRTDFHLS